MNSFLISSIDNLSVLKSIVKAEKERKMEIFEPSSSFCMALTDSVGKILDDVIVKVGDDLIVFIGRLFNKTSLMLLLLNYDQNVIYYNDQQLFLTLYKRFGTSAFSLAEGMYSVILFNDNSCKIFTTQKPGLPIYYTTRNGVFWASNEVKLFIHNHNIDMTLKPIEGFDSFAVLPDTFSLFKYIKTMPEKSEITIKLDCFNRVYVNAHEYNQSQARSSDLEMKKENLIFLLNHSLDNILTDYADLYGQQDDYAIALSGGIDSGLVGSYLRKQAPKASIHSYSIGSESINEFKYAKQCAEFIGSIHHEIFIDDNVFLEGLLNVIYYNEVFDSAFAEVNAPLYVLYKEAAKVSNLLLTGSGADMLFGGILEPNIELKDVNKELSLKFARTKWTGEFNPYLSEYHNLDVRHPFLSSQLFNICQNLDPSFKVNNKCLKYILKELAEELSMLPSEIIWREKIRFEDGVGNNSMFSRFLNLKTVRSYKKKDIYTYEIFKLIFQERVPLKDISLVEVRDRIVRNEFVSA